VTKGNPVTLKLVLSLSIAANVAVAYCWLASDATHPTVPRAVIQKGVGQAYCRPENSNKEADFTLMAAITEEVEVESNLWLTRWWR
jgi:hypothetical protein